MAWFSTVVLGAILVSKTYAQFPPTPEGVTTIVSKFHENVTISYKEPGLCETTPGVKSYSGYVHLPAEFLHGAWEDNQSYPINTFFWFFESRKDPANAPLSIWLNGGPGGSSLMGLLQENGPCFVGADSNSTFLNPWSWNNEVNMLYIDQPVQVGFSYDVPTNVTVNLVIPPPELSDEEVPPQIVPADFSNGVPVQNNTFSAGTMGSQRVLSTSNSTAHAAHALWHFAQTWFEEFPYYKPNDEKISIWTESYGGKYGPGFASFFEEQNDKILNGTISTPGAHILHMDTLGIINGCIDLLGGTATGLADMAYNNTYGIQIYNETVYNGLMTNFTKHGGYRDKLLHCHALAKEKDPHNIGLDPEVTAACVNASKTMEAFITPYFLQGNNAFYDITHPLEDPFPGPYMYGYLQQSWVQAALGVPVNYTSGSSAVSDAFSLAGDFGRGDSPAQIATLLEKGVKVALVYGDRDFACNWIGGERNSLRIKYEGSEEFSSAGYQPVLTTGGEGGMVRQFGNYSFSRVYQAGHEVPSYQPEVAYELFMRSLFNRDLATGLIPTWDGYKTTGPSSTWHIKNEVPERPEPICYILEPSTCTNEQYEGVKNGSAIVENYVVVGYDVKGEEINKEIWNEETQEILTKEDL